VRPHKRANESKQDKVCAENKREGGRVRARESESESESERERESKRARERDTCRSAASSSGEVCQAFIENWI